MRRRVQASGLGARPSASVTTSTASDAPRRTTWGIASSARVVWAAVSSWLMEVITATGRGSGGRSLTASSSVRRSGSAPGAGVSTAVIVGVAAGTANTRRRCCPASSSRSQV